MRIVYFGVPDAGLFCLGELLRAKKNIVGIVPPAPSHQMHELMVETALQNGIKSVFFEKTLQEQSFLEGLRELNPDIGVVFTFDHRIPKEVLEIPKLGFINYHPSLLPEYRGGSPLFYAIANRDKKTGITIHYMDESFDTGDIIAKWQTNIDPDETLGTLFSRMNTQGINMMLDIISGMEKGEFPQRIKQDISGTYRKAPTIKIEKGHTLIDWNWEAQYIEAFVRALNPYFGAMSFFRGCDIKIWSGSYVPNFHDKKVQPGDVYKVSKEAFSIATGKGLFFPHCVQLNNFMITDVKDFIRRVNPASGEKLLMNPLQQ